MILGIDPGTGIVGFAFVSGTKMNPIIIECGAITTQPRPTTENHIRLLEIATDLEELILKHKPAKAIVEDIFFFKNAKTVISVAQARGVILYLLAKHGVEIESVTPLQVKNNLCGYGRATKDQVLQMVMRFYQLETAPKPDDVSDALGIAWLGL